MGNVVVTAAGVGARRCRAGAGSVGSGEFAGIVRGDNAGEALVSGGIGSVRREVADDRIGSVDIPSQRTAADAYRVSDDQLYRARMVVARNSADQEDLRQLLDMLGLISGNPDQPPPVSR
jgi:hypothetical protein